MYVSQFNPPKDDCLTQDALSGSAPAAMNTTEGRVLLSSWAKKFGKS